MEWRTIPGYPGYEVSNTGDVRNSRGWTLRQQTYDGYRRLGLCIDGKCITRKVHRLVAMAFIPNPENKPQVDHINRIASDNRVENLRWATHTEQTENRITPVGVSGNKYINKNGNNWSVYIRKGYATVYCKTFPTIEEAIEARDMFLTQSGLVSH